MAILTADKLDIYNRALNKLGSRKLSAITENREPRRVLDGNWGADNNLVTYALELGDWGFGTRIIELSYNPSVEPAFGHRYAFDKPTDFARLTSISGDEFFTRPLTAMQYDSVAEYWFADEQTLYVKYVSSDGSYGFNSAGWTEAFKQYLADRLAWLSCERLTNSTQKRDRLERDMMKAEARAKSNDAMAEGVKFPPAGSWMTARFGRSRERSR